MKEPEPTPPTPAPDDVLRRMLSTPPKPLKNPEPKPQKTDITGL